MCRTTTPPPVPPIPKNNYKEGKMDMGKNKKMAADEVSVQQQPIQIEKTFNVKNMKFKLTLIASPDESIVGEPISIVTNALIANCKLINKELIEKITVNPVEIQESENKTLGQLEKDFWVRDTPENRMAILHKQNIRTGEIAHKIAEILKNEELSINGAISLVRNVENIIRDSKFNLDD